MNFTALIALSFSVSLVLILLYFYYSTNNKKVKIVLTNKTNYKEKLKHKTTNDIRQISIIKKQNDHHANNVNNEIYDLNYLNELNGIVSGEIERVKENERNLSLVKFNNNKFNKF